MRIIPIVLSFVLFAVSCDGGIKNKPLTAENLKLLKGNEEVTDEDRMLAMAYVMRNARGKEELEKVMDGSITIGEAIEKERERREQDSDAAE